MWFLIDHDVYKVTIDCLKEWGHDVVTVKELGMTRASDEQLLVVSQETHRLFVTRDKGFGALLFLKEQASSGVIFLRISPKTTEDVHQEFERILKEHNEKELRNSFSVIEPGRHRIRHLPT